MYERMNGTDLGLPQLGFEFGFLQAFPFLYLHLLPLVSAGIMHAHDEELEVTQLVCMIRTIPRYFFTKLASEK
jgi:hypothetical protein